MLGAKLPTQSSCSILQAASDWSLVSLTGLKSKGRSCRELPYLVRFPVICQNSWPLDDSATSQKGNSWQEDHAGGKVLTAGRSSTVIAAEKERKKGKRASKTVWSGLLGDQHVRQWMLLLMVHWSFPKSRPSQEAEGSSFGQATLWDEKRHILLHMFSYKICLYWFQKSLARFINKVCLPCCCSRGWNKTLKCLVWWECVCTAVHETRQRLQPLNVFSRVGHVLYQR